MRCSRVVSWRDSVHVNIVEYCVAWCAAKGFSLSHSFLIYLAVHDDHDDTRNPEGYRWTYHGISPIHRKDAHLIDKLRHKIWIVRVYVKTSCWLEFPINVTYQRFGMCTNDFCRGRIVVYKNWGKLEEHDK